MTTTQMLVFLVIRLEMEKLVRLEEHHSAMVCIVDLELIDVTHFIMVLAKHCDTPDADLPCRPSWDGGTCPS